MIPRLDARKLAVRDPDEVARLKHAAETTGFLTISHTALDAARVRDVLAAYQGFFALPEAEKRKVDMARTGSNRGWGASGSEQVSAVANPDYKQVFDCGYELPDGDPLVARNLSVYAPNLWPEELPVFRETIQAYYDDALVVAMQVLRAIAHAIGAPDDYFDAAFARPMALLRGNYYPERPAWAGAQDFGIAAHTDYGCLTLLATDGVPGLEVLAGDGTWVPVQAEPGTFVVNFGEMLEMWTAGRVKATLHRVVGSTEARISVPLFFNPGYDTNVAPPGSGKVIVAGDHLTRRFDETYVHLQKKG